MSATRDKSQKIAFVFTPLHPLFQATAHTPALEEGRGQVRGEARVIKAGITQENTSGPQSQPQSLKDARAPQVRNYQPVELLGNRRIKKPAILQRSQVSASPAREEQNLAVEQLRKNLDSLQQLHARLKFMLQEIDELSGGKKRPPEE